jgi:hypothetical protein
MRKGRRVEETLKSNSAHRLPALSIVALLACVLLWGSIFARMADKNVHLDKDFLLLYVCGLEIRDPSLHDQQLELVNTLVAKSASDHLIYRATMRAGYCNNYFLTSFSMYAAGELQRYFGITDPATDFAKFVTRSIRWGTAISGEVLGVLCLICAFWAARGALTLATFGAVALAALMYLFVPAPNLSWMLHPVPPARYVIFRDILGLNLYSWLNPSAVFSPFSIFPRCLCAMIAFAAFTLRWSGRSAAAYWAPLIVCFVHQSEAPILLAVMIACDLAIRPASLGRLAHVIPIALVAIVIVLRERMFSLLDLPWFIVAMILASIVGLGVVAFAIPSTRSIIRSGWSIVDRWREWLFGRLSVPFAEAIVILAIWSVVLVVCFVLRRDIFFRVIYFWSELPPRYVGLFQLTVVAGLTYPVWLALLKMRPHVAREATAVIAGLMLVLSVHQWAGPWTTPEVLASRSRQIEEASAKGYSGDEGSYSRIETPWYYLILRRAYLGGSGITEYFAKAESRP